MDADCYDSLGGQVALVTGANRGIGRAIADALVGLGATVYGGVRNRSDGTPAQHSVRLDVTEELDIALATQHIADHAGRLDVLVNNAGVGVLDNTLIAEPTDIIDRTLDVNLRGAILCTKHALPMLLEREGGRVVNLSSRWGTFARMSGEGATGEGETGRIDGRRAPAYRISKAGVNALTAYLHAEYGEHGLLANAASPGWVDTEMGNEGAPRTPEEGADTPVWLVRHRPGSPSGRFWHDREPIDW